MLASTTHAPIPPITAATTTTPGAAFSRRRALGGLALGGLSAVAGTTMTGGAAQAAGRRRVVTTGSRRVVRRRRPTTGIVPDFRTQPLMDPGPDKVVLGLFAGTSTPEERLATMAGGPCHLSRVYSGSGMVNGVRACQKHLDAGRIPVLSVNWKAEMKSHVLANPRNVGGTGKTLFRYYADGHFDGDLLTGMVLVPGVGLVPGFRRLAMEILALGKGAAPSRRIVLTPWHEFENAAESGFGTTKDAAGFADFRAGWQRLVTVLRSYGVTRRMCPIMFCGATGPGSWGDRLTDQGSTGFYPGHAWTDIVGWDPYNSSGLISPSSQEPSGGRAKNPWQEFGLAGDRGDGPGSNRTCLNRWGQMSWYYKHFTIGGAPTVAAGGGAVYKPIWLGEFGTGDYDRYNDPTNTQKRADVWFPRMAQWLAEHPEAVKAVIYFNNTFNDVEHGNYRPSGFSGFGTHDVWARVTPRVRR